MAVRRVNLSDPKAPMLQDYVDPKKYTYLPNTAGCYTANDAVRTLRLAREAGGWNLVKLEVLGPPRRCTRHAGHVRGGRSADQGRLRGDGLHRR